VNFNDVYALSEYVPRNSRIHQALELPYCDSDNTKEVNRFAICYRDLAFGWNFVKSFADTNTPLPTTELTKRIPDYNLLQRVYSFERFGRKDTELAFAISIDRVLDPYMKNLLQACLLAEDFEAASVSRQLGIPGNVFLIYEKLFFNTLDRREENAFIASIVYPQTRAVEFDANYALRESYANIMKRTGYRNGISDVLNMAGIRGFLQTGATQMVVKDFENKLMCNALFLSNNGFLNTSHVGITNAKNLLAAAKHGGDLESGSSADATGAGSIGNELLDEVVNAGMTETEKRRLFVIEQTKEAEG
jgi:hypothetical protein